MHTYSYIMLSVVHVIQNLHSDTNAVKYLFRLVYLNITKLHSFHHSIVFFSKACTCSDGIVFFSNLHYKIYCIVQKFGGGIEN